MTMRICGALLAAGLMSGMAGTASAGSNFSLFIGGGAPAGPYYAPAPVYGPPVYHGYYPDYYYGYSPRVYFGYGGHHHHHHPHHGGWHGYGHHHGHHGHGHHHW